jgi:serine/threonine-protein phosphatase 6 regulatory ankyrin repeat subunit B
MLNILECLLRLLWHIIFPTGLSKLLEMVPWVRNHICKEELVRGGTDYNSASFIASASGGQIYIVKLFTCAGILLNTPGTDGDTALIAAASHGHNEVVSHLLSLSEIDINVQNQIGDTALMTATRGGHDETVRYLLDPAGIKLNLQNETGDTALIMAARKGYQNIIVQLLQQTDIDVNVRNKSDESALLEAARHEYQQIVKQLAAAGAVEPELEKKVARWQLEQLGIYTERDFVRTAATGDIELIQKYLAAGMDVNEQGGVHGDTCLIAATRSRKLEMLKLLLRQSNTDVNLTNWDGITAAEIAFTQKYQELLELLREAGAEIDVKELGRRRLEDRGVSYSPKDMIFLAGMGEESLVAMFLDAGMYINAKDDCGNTALIEASRGGKKSIAELLIARGADVNLRNEFGSSALEIAIGNGYSDIAELLRANGAEEPQSAKEHLLAAIKKGDIDEIRSSLGQGASPDIHTEDGEPVLVAAVHHERVDIVKLLVEKGALVDAKDRDQKTALMHAASIGATDIIHYLVEEGAKIEDTDADGSTALMLAVWQKQLRAVQILIEAGANVNASDKKGRTVLMIANLQEHPAILRLLKAVGLREESLEAKLLAAAARGDDSKVKSLLVAGANMQIQDKAGNTPLALAAARGWTQVIEVLKPDKELVNKANSVGDTPLMQAARGGHLSAVELLLGHEANIQAVNAERETALLQAAAAGKGPMVKLLTERCADPTRGACGTSPLIETCYHGQLDAVTALIRKIDRADRKRSLNHKLEYGFSPLMTAMLGGNEDIIELLRREGASLGDLEGQVFLRARDGDAEALKKINFEEVDLNARDRNGWTALMVAAREGYEGITKILLDAPVKTPVKTSHQSRDGKTTALMEAAINNRTEVLGLLLSKTERDNNVETRALVESAANGHAEVVRLLFNKGKVSIDGLPSGRVPLVEAAMRGHLQTVQILLELGANKEKQSRDGLTAIMAAQLHKHDRVVERLIESGCEAGLKEIRLLMAASEGKVDEVERLLTQSNPARLNARDEQGRTALMRACKEGHQSVVEVLLENYSDERDKVAAASDTDDRGRTPLMWAVKGGNAQIADRLLGLGADLHSEAKDKRTALMEACKWGRFHIVEILLDRMANADSRRVAVNHQDEHNNTPLGEALLHEVPKRESEYEMIISLLEQNGAEVGRDVSEFLYAVRECKADKVWELIEKVDFKMLRLHRKTPLMLCAESDCTSVATILLDRGADVNEVGPSGDTALMLAVKNGCRNMIKLLIGSHADPDRINAEESSALIEATQLEAEYSVKELINAGANVNHRSRAGNTALTVAVTKWNLNLINLLLASRPKLNLDRPDGERRTALTLAHLLGTCTHQLLPSPEEPVEHGFLQKLTQVERLLIEAGARKGWNEAELILAAKAGDHKRVRQLMGKTDVNIRDTDGSTALLIACQEGDLEVTRVLLDSGASVAIRNESGRTPLMEAAKKHSPELTKLLLQAEPDLDLNAQDEQGETALLEATRAGASEIVQLLIDKGVNVNTANRRGEAPVIEMAKHDSPKVVRSLLENGANACARDGNHRTAIIAAAKHGRMPIIEVLLRHLESRLSDDPLKLKTVINAIDHDSRTAVDWAKQSGCGECANLLSQHGGRSVDETCSVVFTTPYGNHYHALDCKHISHAKKYGTLKRCLLRQALNEQYEICADCRQLVWIEKIEWSC